MTTSPSTVLYIQPLGMANNNIWIIKGARRQRWGFFYTIQELVLLCAATLSFSPAISSSFQCLFVFFSCSNCCSLLCLPICLHFLFGEHPAMNAFKVCLAFYLEPGSNLMENHSYLDRYALRKQAFLAKVHNPWNKE